MPTQDPSALPYRVAALERDVEAMKQNHLETEVAVIKVELAGVKAERSIDRQKIELLETRVTASSSAWAGSKATIILILAVIGGVGGLIFSVLQAVGGH
jgi:hypothetical protein